MKKVSLLLVLTVVLTIFSFDFVFAYEDVSVYVDGNITQLTDVNGNYVYPFIQDGSTYVPLRGVSQVLGCDVIWDDANTTILIYDEMQSDNSVFRNNSNEIKLYVDNKLIELKNANGSTVKPIVIDGTTYVPLRGVSQALGCFVRWNGNTKTVYVWDKIVPPDGVSLSENKPYDRKNYDFAYETDGQYIKFDNKNYTNAIEFGSLGYALFNLDGKYNKMTFTLGAYRGDEVNLSFIVDGKIVDNIILRENSPVTDFEVNLEYGLELKITNEYVSEGAAMGNIIFWDK